VFICEISELATASIEARRPVPPSAAGAPMTVLATSRSEPSEPEDGIPAPSTPVVLAETVSGTEAFAL
jgi:hypothetical protein